MLALASFLSVASAASAGAETAWWLAPADPDQGFLGPGAAQGAVVWSHGRSVEAEDYLAPTPLYMTVLRQNRWDTYRFNRKRDGDTLADSARALVGAVRELKQRGYARIVLAGQSFGAFLSLMAADDSDDIHAVIATAPAAFGSFSEFYGSWRLNASRLYPLLEHLRGGARVMLFFFHGDDFDPGGRGERAREILEARGADYLLIDQPMRLVGHWAAATPAFAERFARCMLDFVDAPAGQVERACDPEDARVADDASAAAPGRQASISPRAVATAQ